MTIIYAVFIFILGLMFGSFFNVLIYRLPRKKSIVSPPSACPSCSTKIKWYDNIPVLSYMILRGKCRYCREPISPLYPSVEMLTGIVFLAVFIRTGLNASFIVYTAAFSFLIVLSFIDLFFKEVNVWSLFVPAGFIGLLYLLRYMTDIQFIESGYQLPLAGALIGLAAGAVLFAVVRFLATRMMKREAMGEADIYIAGLMGLILGYEAFFFALIFAGITGIVFYYAVRKENNDPEIPFIPFLSMGCFIAFLMSNILRGLIV